MIWRVEQAEVERCRQDGEGWKEGNSSRGCLRGLDLNKRHCESTGSLCIKMYLGSVCVCVCDVQL